MKEQTIANKQDYCTSFPESLFGIDLSYCCKAHDLAYEVQIPKNEADIALFKCVYDSADGWLVVPSLLVAALMFTGVTAFGRRFYNQARMK